MNQYTIIKNSAQCRKCLVILESKHAHDFQACDCFQESDGATGIAIDGGTDYIRHLGSLEYFKDLSQWQDITEKGK